MSMATTIAGEELIYFTTAANPPLNEAIMNRWSRETPVTVFAGPGNNGGDALAVARMLSEKGYKTEVYLFNPKGELSPDCQTNKELVEMAEEVTFHEISTQFVPPTLRSIRYSINPIRLHIRCFRQKGKRVSTGKKRGNGSCPARTARTLPDSRNSGR